MSEPAPAVDRDELVQQLQDYHFPSDYEPDASASLTMAPWVILKVLLNKGIITEEDFEEVWQEEMATQQRKESEKLADKLITTGETFEQYVKTQGIMNKISGGLLGRPNPFGG